MLHIILHINYVKRLSAYSFKAMNIRIVQRNDVVYKNGTSPLAIRFTHERKNKFIGLGVSVLPEHWDNQQQTVSSFCPDYAEIQAKISGQISEYKRKVQRLEILEIPVTFDNLFETKKRRANFTIADCFEREIARLETLGKHGSASKHRSAVSLLNMAQLANVRLEDIDLAFLNDFELFLRKRGNVDNSIATKFAITKAVYNKAISEDLFVPKANPFTKFKVGRLWTPTRKRAIEKDELQKLIDFELPADYPSPYLAFAKDIFLFTYFTAGINFGDIARLRHCDIQNGRVYYTRHKTGKDIKCPLMPIAEAIIRKYSRGDYADADYIFPILNKREHITERQKFDRIHKVIGKVNIQLKELGELAGLKTPLTTYVARHTYATVLKRSGVNIAIISESLGHSDLATTQIYLDSFENSQIDEAMQTLACKMLQISEYKPNS